MKNKTIFFGIFICTFTLLFSTPAFALTIHPDPDVPYAIESNNNNGTVTVAVGGNRDLNGFLVTRATSGDDNYDGYDWYLVDSIAWTSSNPEVLTINSGGVATAHKAGVSKVTASFYDNQSRRHMQTLTLRATLSGEVSSLSSFTLSEGKFIDLMALLHPGYTSNGTYGTVEWANTNSGVATVDSAGLLTAKSVGTCRITATHTAPDGAVTSRQVAIKVTALLLNEKNHSITLALSPGESVDLVRLFYPKYADNPNITKGMQCSSNEEAVAAVNGFKLTAKSAGSCTVTLKYTDARDDYETQKFTIVVA